MLKEPPSQLRPTLKYGTIRHFSIFHWTTMYVTGRPAWFRCFSPPPTQSSRPHKNQFPDDRRATERWKRKQDWIYSVQIRSVYFIDIALT